MKTVKICAFKKKTVAMVTWVSGTTNYGTILQAYALQKYLCNLGFDVKHCDYIPDGTDVIWPSKIRLKLRYGLRKIRARANRFKERNNYIKDNIHACEEFIRNNILLTSKCVNKEEVKKCLCEFDYVICGSDQIWNIARKKNPVYFLNVDVDSVKIAYAPSMPVKKIRNSEKNWILNVLSSFHGISVRERYTKNILERIGVSNVEDVLDPVFLIEKSEWDNFSEIVKNLNNKKYIYCYFLDDKSKYIRFVKYIMKKLVISCVCIQTPTSVEWSDDNSYLPGPKAFIGFIKNASFVVTDSYHAMLFSVIYKKNFFVVKRFFECTREYQNLRCIDFLCKIGLNDRFVSRNSKPQQVSEIDYASVGEKLDLEKKKSYEFLCGKLEMPKNGEI